MPLLIKTSSLLEIKWQTPNGPRKVQAIMLVLNLSYRITIVKLTSGLRISW